MKESKPISIKGMILFIVVLLNAIILRNGLIISDRWYWGLLVTIPLFVIAIIRNFSLIRHLRYFFECLRKDH